MKKKTENRGNKCALCSKIRKQIDEIFKLNGSDFSEHPQKMSVRV
jgi:hypothetical protein